MSVVKCSLVMALVLLALARQSAAQGLFSVNDNGGLFGSGNQEVDFHAGDNAGVYPGENNGYLPPPNGQGESSNQNPSLLPPPGDNSGRDDSPTNVVPNTAFPPRQPQVGCAAALICVEEQFCTMTGVISKTALQLTPAQKLRQVPMVDCRNPDNGVIGKCCRDPDYVDPWPAGGSLPPNYKGGFDDRGFPIYLNLTGKDLNQLAHPNRPVQPAASNQVVRPVHPSGPQQTFTPVRPVQPSGPQQTFNQRPIRPQVIVPQSVPSVPFQQQPTGSESKIVPGKPEQVGSIQQPAFIQPEQPEQPEQNYVIPEQPEKIFVSQQPSQSFVPHESESHQFQQPIKTFGQQPQQAIFGQKQPKPIRPAQQSQTFIHQQPEQPSQVFVQQPQQPSQVIVQQPEQPIQTFVQLQPHQPSFVHQPQQPSQVIVQQPSLSFGEKVPQQPIHTFQPQQPIHTFQPQQPIHTFQPQQPQGFVPQATETPEEGNVIVPEAIAPEQPSGYRPQGHTGYPSEQPQGFKVVVPEQPEVYQQPEQPVQQEIPFGQPAPGKTFGGQIPSLPQLNLPQINIPEQIQNFFKPQKPPTQDSQIINAPADVPDVPLGVTTNKPFFQNIIQNLPGFGGKNVDSIQGSTYIAPHRPGSQCGIINQVQRPSGLLDVETSFGEIPWEAMILHNVEKKLLCSGVFVAPNAVLTAAHCVYGVNPSEVSVKAGEWKLGFELKHEEPLPFEIVGVESIVSHPSYQIDGAGHDLALLFLQKSIKLDQHVDTICVPQQPIAQPIGPKKCISAGWGKSNLQLHLAGSKMNKIDVDVLDNNVCRQRVQYAENPLNLDDSLVCVKAQAESNNMCQVDIGGPLACDRGDGIYEIVGVYSQDTGCQPTNQVATFALVDSQWVNEMLSTPVTQFGQVPEQPQQQSSKIHYHPNQPNVPCDCQVGTQPAGANGYLPPY